MIKYSSQYLVDGAMYDHLKRRLDFTCRQISKQNQLLQSVYLFSALIIKSRIMIAVYGSSFVPFLRSHYHPRAKQTPPAFTIRCSATPNDHHHADQQSGTRRDTLRSLVAAATTLSLPLCLSLSPPLAHAVQGSIAGRIPGISGPGADGYYIYTRPEGKSGGHGVGWSEIPRYSFKIPEGWDEVPVSIADLGGTEIDLRYGKDDSGKLFIIVAPVLRFKDVGVNADVRIDFLGTPDQIIAGFAPEIFGGPLDEGDVLATETATKNGVLYYFWEVKPHHLVAATAVGNRLFMMVLTANSRQWRKAGEELRVVQKSFSVPALG